MSVTAMAGSARLARSPCMSHSTRRPAPFQSGACSLKGSAASAFLGTSMRVQTCRVQQQAAALRRLPLRVQNVRINNVEIPNNKRIETSLQYIYGIGLTTAKKIMAEAAVENKRAYELNEEELSKIREEVGKFQTEADLRRAIAQNIKRLKDIGSYRGRRHIMGLPVRGQRTKTNARTRKGKPKTVAGKKKAAK